MHDDTQPARVFEMSVALKMVNFRLGGFRSWLWKRIRFNFYARLLLFWRRFNNWFDSDRLQNNVCHRTLSGFYVFLVREFCGQSGGIIRRYS
jgi:hypothetical protein